MRSLALFITPANYPQQQPLSVHERANDSDSFTVPQASLQAQETDATPVRRAIPPRRRHRAIFDRVRRSHSDTPRATDGKSN